MNINGQEISELRIYGTKISDKNFKTLVDEGIIEIDENKEELKDSKKELVSKIVKASSKDGIYCLDLLREVTEVINNCSSNSSDKEYMNIGDLFNEDSTDEEVQEMLTQYLDEINKSSGVLDSRQIIILLYAAMLYLPEEDFKSLTVIYEDIYGYQRNLLSYDKNDNYQREARQRLAMLEILKKDIIDNDIVLAELNVLDSHDL